jgi:hypothetical protein
MTMQTFICSVTFQPLPVAALFGWTLPVNSNMNLETVHKMNTSVINEYKIT